MPWWKWRGGDGYVRDLVEVEFIGLGNLDIEMSRKSKIAPKLRAWVIGRMGIT